MSSSSKFTILPGNLFQSLIDHGKKLFACRSQLERGLTNNIELPSLEVWEKGVRIQISLKSLVYCPFCSQKTELQDTLQAVMYTCTLICYLLTRLIFNTNKIEKRSALVAMGYNGLPDRTLPINLIHETARRSERVDNAALSSAASYEIPGQMMERALFARSQDSKQNTQASQQRQRRRTLVQSELARSRYEQYQRYCEIHNINVNISVDNTMEHSQSTELPSTLKGGPFQFLQHVGYNTWLS